MNTYTSHSPKETNEIARLIAQEFEDKGGFITLQGDLGAGKTTFVQGFAQALGITDKVTSPSYVVVRQYQIPNSKRWLYHLDLYRLNAIQAASELGIEEMLEDNNIVLVEWPEKLEHYPKTPTKAITFIHKTESARILEVEP